MPPAAASGEKKNLGPLHTVSQTAFPRPRQKGLRPLCTPLSFTDGGRFFFLYYPSIEENNAKHSFVSARLQILSHYTASQTCTVLSLLAEAMYCPPGAQAMEYTQ